MAAAAAGIAATADDGITFGAWGRAIWNTAANSYNLTDDKNEVVTGINQGWGGNAPRNGLAVHGAAADETIGFNLDFHWNGDELADNSGAAHIWWKPIEQVKVIAGKTDNSELRGDAAFGMWNWDRIGAVRNGADAHESEGWTFPGLFDVTGANIIVYPIEGLTVGVGIPLGKTQAKAATLKDTYIHGANYVAAYAIPDIGTIKAGVETKVDAYTPKGEKKSYAVIDAAFDLTGVDNLFLSIGASIPTAHVFTTTAASTSYSIEYKIDKNGKIVIDDEASSYTTTEESYSQSVIQVNAYGNYKLLDDALTIHGIVGTKINSAYKDGDEDKEDGGFGFLVGAGVDYNFDNGLGVFADLRYANGIYMVNSSDDDTDTFTFGLGVSKSYSNGVIGIAFEGTTHGGQSYGDGSYGRYSYKKASDFAWEIPVKFEYSF